jgi:hypothetical protein
VTDQPRAPGIWITHAWADDTSGNFDYIISRLEAVGVEARYDRRDLVPGLPLWPQIEDRITKDPIDGWGIILTRHSLSSRPCREELNYALGRALGAKGEQFKLIGLLDGDVPMSDVPAPLKTRLCVNLENAGWPTLVRKGLEGEAHGGPAPFVSEYHWTVHSRYKRSATAPAYPAVEVRPRFGQIGAWIFLVPPGTKVMDCAPGSAGGHPLNQWRVNCSPPSPDQKGVITEGPMTGAAFEYFGAADPLSTTRSAYAVFEDSFPEWVGFTPVPESGPVGFHRGRMEVMVPSEGRFLIHPLDS